MLGVMAVYQAATIPTLANGKRRNPDFNPAHFKLVQRFYPSIYPFQLEIIGSPLLALLLIHLSGGVTTPVNGSA
jgi:hypothetical protein